MSGYRHLYTDWRLEVRNRRIKQQGIEHQEASQASPSVEPPGEPDPDQQPDPGAFSALPTTSAGQGDELSGGPEHF